MDAYRLLFQGKSIQSGPFDAYSQTTDVVPYEPKEVVPYEPAPVPVTVREQIARLIDVKSIMTLILICTLCYMAINGRELDERFMTIIVSVVTFYFSYQSKKG